MICPFIKAGIAAGPRLARPKAAMVDEMMACTKDCALWTGENCAVTEICYWPGKLIRPD